MVWDGIANTELGPALWEQTGVKRLAVGLGEMRRDRQDRDRGGPLAAGIVQGGLSAFPDLGRHDGDQVRHCLRPVATDSSAALPCLGDGRFGCFPCLVR